MIQSIYMPDYRITTTKKTFVMSCILYTPYIQPTCVDPYPRKKTKLFEQAKGLYTS